MTGEGKISGEASISLLPCNQKEPLTQTKGTFGHFRFSWNCYIDGCKFLCGIVNFLMTGSISLLMSCLFRASFYSMHRSILYMFWFYEFARRGGLELDMDFLAKKGLEQCFRI